jgi:transposase
MHATAQLHPSISTVPQLLNYKQAAETCGVCEATIRNWIRRGDLIACKLGGKANSAVRIDSRDLAAFLDRTKTETAGRKAGG